MTPVFTPSIDISLGILAALGIFGAVVLGRRVYRRYYTMRHHLRVVELRRDSSSLKRALAFLTPPFTIEVAVHQLGRDVHSYVALPAKKAEKFTLLTGWKQVPDYNIYHPGGAYLGGSLRTKEASSLGVDIFLRLLTELDFSKVNEVGEGVVFQLVFGRRGRGNSVRGNARVLVSAPTPYQAQEIVASLKKELSGCKWAEGKDRDFVDAVTYRKFNPREGMVWTLS
jgi:hypothetical protein